LPKGRFGFLLTSMANELTYILGAGASYQSIPVVKTFAARFEEFKNEIKLSLNYSKVTPKLISDIEDFSYELKSHQSFDTYFKKRFHLGDEIAIMLAKKIINLYFLWEQIQLPQKPQIYLDNDELIQNSREENSSGGIFYKESQIDKRYDALIAGLIKPIKGNTELFTKVNFISWNYDLNLLMSIKNFLNPDENINNFIEQNANTNDDRLWQFQKDLQVINMNGYFYSSNLDSIKNITNVENEKLFDFVYNKAPYFEIESGIPSQDANKIRFAWENNVKLSHDAAIFSAKNAIKNSKNIVVIGYTFPLYNRLVDSQYFNLDLAYRIKNGEVNITIQDPNADSIAENFAEFNAGHKSDGKFLNKKMNCDSFYIPSNIFELK
jgi:hypothetical protein